MANNTAKWVYGFHQLKAVERRARTWDAVRGLLGGKGANLCEMTRLGLPVPAGFIVTTEACVHFFRTGKAPRELDREIDRALAALEEESGLSLGDPDAPLLLSCRSGAKFSMPGMMDTVLNLGLTPQVVATLAARTGDARFAWDSYRRLVQMFGAVVLGAPEEPFEAELERARAECKVTNDAALPAAELERITRRFRALVEQHTGAPFPDEPRQQLRLAIEAVFRSWKSPRATEYRRAAKISDELGTAVTVMRMVFGNHGEDSATGVATTRNVSTGERTMEGDFLINAQGEDVVSGTRQTEPLARLGEVMPKLKRELDGYAQRLERHFRDVQDLEFTIERGKLWMLQTRDAKRTARAAVRIAVELAKEKRISKEDAVRRVKPEHVEFFLHPQFDAAAVKQARADARLLASGLNVSPGAATGALVFDADTAVRLAKEKKDVVLIRLDTRPDDVHGLLAARGIITSRGGRTSHAALVARQFGKPAVVGAQSLEINLAARTVKTADGRLLKEGDEVSLDGATGEIFSGRIETKAPGLDDPNLLQILSWADAMRRLEVLTNADTPRDAARARELGAEGIGLTRTEHMFFEADRLPLVQRLIVTHDAAERDELLGRLLPLQRGDFEGLLEVMHGLPVTIRLIDPPLHEFLPSREVLIREVATLQAQAVLDDPQRRELSRRKALLESVELLHEDNPMLGLRGVRLGIERPEIVTMQVRALFEAACDVQRRGKKVRLNVMIPLVSHREELRIEREQLEQVAKVVMKEKGQKIRYHFGTMVETPRAALTADEIARFADFFSFGTNDLTQTTFGISRDDAETGFLADYLKRGILRTNPFATLDEKGVGQLMALAVKKGRATNAKLHLSICGEHGGDPESIALCERLGLDAVSCSPLRVPIARLAAAHAT